MSYDNYSEQDVLALYEDAEFYDHEFALRNDEIPFYTLLLKDRCSVLEVACGTGRITIPLKNSGINISGTDISPQMISRAKTRAEKVGLDIKYSVENAMQTTGRYDTIFIATNAFQHFTQTRDATDFLKSAGESLTDDGQLIVDLQIPDIKKLSRDPSVARHYKTFELKGRDVNAEIKGKYEPLSQLYMFVIQYYMDHKCIVTIQLTSRIRHFGVRKWTHMRICSHFLP
ncbi:MAG TPA: class I SAM-dependent methyltransferase [Gammaproteobacteria bacterium]|nr:class I SAM-dependent methyltransferase [Gammaproteobacteria bacterium]